MRLEEEEMNCLRLSESECLAASHGLKDARCIWRARSHYGMRLEEEEMNGIVVKEEVESAEGVDLESAERVDMNPKERVDLEAYDHEREESWNGENDSETVVSPKLG